MAAAEPSFVTEARAYRERALRSLAFGVSSTPRGRQEPAPLVSDRAEDAHVFDVSGQRFVDFAMGYGPLILGHSPAPVIAAIKSELDRGLRTASVHRGEAELAELIAEHVPSAELSAFVSSGSEAVQLALRIARAATGRTRVVKFRGNYHGWLDSVQVADRPGDDGPGTLGQDPAAAASLTLLDWGDIEALKAALTRDHAAVILEPMAVNGGCFLPPRGFLEEVRALTRELGVLLIFDEVISGFRLALGGAQSLTGVVPDLTVLGKAMGGGVPISAVAGSRAAMEPVASGKLNHRGTFNGNPLSVAASIACIGHLAENAPTLYAEMDGRAVAIASYVRNAAAQRGIALSVSRIGSAIQIFLGAEGISTFAGVAQADMESARRFAAALLQAGVQIIPRGLMYLSAAHTDADIEDTKSAIDAALGALDSRAS